MLSRPAPSPASPPPTNADNPPVPFLRKPVLPLPLLAKQAGSSTDATAILRPPGALPDGMFETMCKRCNRCVEACPAQAISPLANGSGAGTPHIDPVSGPCILCDGLKCTHACPSGALQPLETPIEVRIGTACIEAPLCTAWRGLPCRICYEVCPIPGVIMLAKGERTFVPVAGETPCVGCGICQHYCPVDGAVRIVPYDRGKSGQVRVSSSTARDP
jgi:ferredoxin-type protein NapG